MEQKETGFREKDFKKEKQRYTKERKIKWHRPAEHVKETRLKSVVILENQILLHCNCNQCMKCDHLLRNINQGYFLSHYGCCSFCKTDRVLFLFSGVLLIFWCSLGRQNEPTAKETLFYSLCFLCNDRFPVEALFNPHTLSSGKHWIKQVES